MRGSHLAVGAREADGANAAVGVEQVNALAPVAAGARGAVVDVALAGASRVTGGARAVKVVHEVNAGGTVEALAYAIVHVELTVAACPPREAGAGVRACRVVASGGIYARTLRALLAAHRPHRALVHVCNERPMYTTLPKLDAPRSAAGT